MRKQSGAYLLETLVVITMTSIFILLISSLLSQVMRISTQAQNEFITASLAEVLIENSRATPYSVLSNPLYQNTTYNVAINLPDTASYFPLRTIPAQLNLNDDKTIYGAIEGTTGQLRLSEKWTPSSGNFFRGKATIKIENSTALTSGLNSVKVTVTVSYYNDSGILKSKQSRVAHIFEGGSNFR